MRRTGAQALLATLLLAGACSPPRPASEVEPVPQLTMERVRFAVDRDGKTRATGEADEVVYRRDTGEVAAAGLSMVLAAEDGKVLVTAPVGSGSTVERRYEVSGGVRAERGRDVATTPSARLEPAGDQGRGRVLQGDGPVLLEGPGYRLTGTGFTLDPASGELALRGKPRLLTGLGERR